MAVTHWIRFHHKGKPGFGILSEGKIAVHDGDMFGAAKPTGETLDLDGVEVLPPTTAGKYICLWNNFKALAQKLNLPEPEEPLYLIKAATSYLGHGGTIRRPVSYAGRVVFEGELGIVIGKRATNVSEADAPRYIFGYTCINDVTAGDLINKDKTFAQWTRAKSFDTFGVFGPVVVQGFDPSTAKIRTVLNGEVRQDYPVADMVHGPVKLVSKLSHDMTLLPGDVIACGTSVGVGSMKGPSDTIEVTIDGVGTLRNMYQG